MTKRDDQGITEEEFNALVDDGFKRPEKKRRKTKGNNRSGVWVPPASLLRELEREGQQDGLTKLGARFNGIMGRIFGNTHPLTPDGVKFVNDIERAGRATMKARGIEIDDDEEGGA